MPKQSRIMREVMEGVTGLLHAGVIDTDQYKEFEALCSLSPKFNGEDVKELRQRLKVSQPELADILNASIHTVQSWESGQQTPSKHYCKLLDILSRKGIEALG